MRSIEASGSWFIASNPERKVTGTLIFEPSQHPKLSLIEPLSLENLTSFFEPKIYPNIIGQASIKEGSKKYISLFNSKISISKFGSDSSVTLISEFFIVADKPFCFESINDIESCNVVFKHLTEWVRRNAFSYEPQSEKSQCVQEEGFIHYVRHEPLKIAESNGFEIFLDEKPIFLDGINFWTDSKNINLV